MRRIDKTAYEIPTCDIMGVRIAAIDMAWLINFLKDNLNLIKGNYVCVSNVHTTVMAYDNEYYCDIQNGALMAIPDGGPLASIGHKRGFSNMQRTTGPSLMEEIFKISEENDYKHFFYGSTQETLDKLKVKLKKKYKGIQIVGMYSPPFRDITAVEDKKIVNTINQSKADFVWVGLGAPKQEVWMAKHKYKINCLMIGVGAGFDYFAGNISRAPIWMQKSNLEWVYRLIQDPKRLFKRYLITNTQFIWNAVIRGK